MNDKDIHIGNLTVYQMHLLDKIWACDSEDELRSWLDTLPSTVLKEAVTLIQLLQLEILDQRWDEEEEDLSDANQVLKQFML